MATTCLCWTATLTASMGRRGGVHDQVVFNMRGREGGSMPEVDDTGVAAALRSASGGSTRSMVAFYWPPEVADPLTANEGSTYSHEGSGNFRLHNVVSGVRRLTPRECERLQGFPDDYTLIPYPRRLAADGPRYRAIGNSMPVPVMRWIGERIMAVESTCASS